MRQFESQVEQLKYLVRRETAKLTIIDKLEEYKDQIPYVIIKGSKPEYRCCIHKERAIVAQRVRLASGKRPITIEVVDDEYKYKYIENDNGNASQIVYIIESACEQCPIDRYHVTEACKGCMIHNCVKACAKGAIKIVNQRAVIDYDKCIECGRCEEACLFGAIVEIHRPCLRVCEVNAIQIDDDKKAVINSNLCTNCGVCTRSCPFGAIGETSELVDMMKKLKSKCNSVAIINPSIFSQFDINSFEELEKILKQIGFNHVVNADEVVNMWIEEEINNFKEDIQNKKCIVNSNCIAFVKLIKTKYPELAQNISKTKPFMVFVTEWVRQKFKDSHITFIGSCIAKKFEKNEYEATKNINIITYEELSAVLDAYKVNINIEIKGNNKDVGEYRYEIIGGFSDILRKRFLKDGIEFESIVCDGMQESIKILNMLRNGKLSYNYIEGFMCSGGCVLGPGAISRDNKTIEKYINTITKE